MEMGDALREQASSWSLSGDRQLLDILQQLHKKVMSNVKQANTKLDEMTSSILDAGVALHNVNNRMMALSNSQFVESRVYDDDDEAEDEPPPQQMEQPRVGGRPSVAELLQAVAALEHFYEAVRIRPDSSDDGSDSDDDLHSVAVRAAPARARAPLPPRIGSARWRLSTHAGLLEEDSDTESATSRRGSETDSYSEGRSPGGRQPSLTSESIAVSEDSYRKVEPINASLEPPQPQSQSSVAAELARRLGDPDRVRAALYWEEPPPLSPPLSQPHSDDDMFGGDSRGDPFSHSPPHVIQSTPNATLKDDNINQKDDISIESQEKVPNKNPAGAVSLFDNKISTEIGAAILRRNQKQSTSSDEEPEIKSQHKPHKINKNIPKTNENIKQSREILKNTAKGDIFDDLFVKSKETNNIILKDDIFDDIDDIFATDAPKTTNKTPTTNIFDDNDDLFAGINFETNTKKEIKLNVTDFKDIFADDNEDDLFSDSKDKHLDTKLDNGALYKREDVNSNTTKDIKSSINIIDKDGTDKITSINKNVIIPEDLKLPYKNVQSPSLFDEDDEIDCLFNTSSNKTKSIKESLSDVSKNHDINEEQCLQPKTNELEHNQTNFNKEIKVENEPLSSETISILSNVKDSPKKEIEIIEREYQQDEFDKTNDIPISTNIPVEKELTHTAIGDIFDNALFTKNIMDKTEPFSCADLETVDDNLNRNQDIENSKNINVLPTEQEFPVKLESHSSDLLNVKNDLLTTEIINTPKNSFINDELATIFNDQPPIFEKSKETKKSKNINALFDDDSDDEALFFKKSDNFEDKVDDDEFEIKKENVNFGLFHDEPPELTNDIFSNDDEVKITKNETRSKDIFSEASPSLNGEDTKPVDRNIALSKEIVENEFIPTYETEYNAEGDLERIVDKKPIGRIKSNININVNTLLPGASPKKTVKIHEDKTNVNPVKQKKQDENYYKLVKSASFEDVPDASVLCNKVSKERPRIQVKRRPSSRKARQDAIKKSNTDSDLGNSEYLTDNLMESENNFGISTLGNVYTNVMIIDNSNLSDKEIDIKNDEFIGKNEEADNVNVKQLTIIDDDDDDIFKSFASKTKEIQNIINIEPNNSFKNNDSDDNEFNIPAQNISKTDEKFQTLFQYDNIFKTTNVTEKKLEKQEVFENNPTKDVKKNNQTIFEDEDDNIFKANVTTKNIEKQEIIEETPLKKDKKYKKPKLSLFDSSSDEELFGAKKKEGNTKIQEEKSSFTKNPGKGIVKSSDSESAALFGDDAGDHQLSADTTYRTESLVQPAWDDPLSRGAEGSL